MIFDDYVISTSIVSNARADMRTKPSYNIYLHNTNDPNKVLTKYRYRINLGFLQKGMLSEVRIWCKENCSRNYEIIPIRKENNRVVMVCAFEKKLDYVTFKLRWL